MSAEARLRAALADLWPAGAPGRVGLAVSGGGDSMALLEMMRRAGGPALDVVTVDHGLRRDSAAEAAFVADHCRAAGLPHATLRWGGWDGRGNLQQAAREARRRLIARWATERGIGAILTGHSRDDRAETFLLRLARGSGVDGLAALPPRARGAGVEWLRPLLGFGREELRAWNRARGVPWIEDPTNDDPRFDRVRARAALAALGDLGLGPARLADTAARMATARAALEQATQAAAAAHARLDRGDVLIDLAALQALPEEIAQRLLAHALRWVSGAAFRPRLAALAGALDQAAAGRAATLHGCLLAPAGGALRVGREPGAVDGLAARPGEVWDGRWRLDGPARPGCRIAMTGEAGLADCPDWRATGLPRASQLAAPAVWQGPRLIAAPLAGRSNGWHAWLVRDEAEFLSSILAD